MHTLHTGQPATPDRHQCDCAARDRAYRYHLPNRAGARDEVSTHARTQCESAPPRSPERHQRGRQLVVAVFGTAVAAVGLGAATAGRMTPAGVAYLVAGAAVLAVLFHLAITSMERHSARALRTARWQVSAGRAEGVRGGTARGDEIAPGVSATGLVLYLSLAAVAVVTALAPVAVAGARGCRGKPVAPMVVGPDRLARVTPQ